MIALLAYWRLAAGAVVLGLVIWAGWLVMSWRDDSHHLAAVTETLAAERASHAREIALSAQASRNLSHELETIRARPAIGPVRLCRTAPVSRMAVTATGTDDPPAAAGVGLSGAQGSDTQGTDPGPDIGPDIDAVGAKCDALTAQLRASQGWWASFQAEPAR